MQQVTLNQFESDIRSLHHVVIVSSLVGKARLTSYKQRGKVKGIVREFNGVRSYFINK